MEDSNMTRMLSRRVAGDNRRVLKAGHLFLKFIEMITPEELTKTGWKKMGNAWYGPANKKLTNFDGKWQIWREGKAIEVTQMNEL